MNYRLLVIGFVSTIVCTNGYTDAGAKNNTTDLNDKVTSLEFEVNTIKDKINFLTQDITDLKKNVTTIQDLRKDFGPVQTKRDIDDFNINNKSNPKALFSNSVPVDTTVQNLRKEFDPVQTKKDIDDFNINNKSNPEALLSNPVPVDTTVQDLRKEFIPVQTKSDIDDFNINSKSKAGSEFIPVQTKKDIDDFNINNKSNPEALLSNPVPVDTTVQDLRKEFIPVQTKSDIDDFNINSKSKAGSEFIPVQTKKDIDNFNINNKSNPEALLSSQAQSDNSSATVQDLRKEFGPVQTKRDIDDFNINSKSNSRSLLDNNVSELQSKFELDSDAASLPQDNVLRLEEVQLPQTAKEFEDVYTPEMVSRIKNNINSKLNDMDKLELIQALKKCQDECSVLNNKLNSNGQMSTVAVEKQIANVTENTTEIAPSKENTSKTVQDLKKEFGAIQTKRDIDDFNINKKSNSRLLLDNNVSEPQSKSELDSDAASLPEDNQGATVNDLKKEFGPVQTKRDIDDFNVNNKSNPENLLSSPAISDKGQDSKQDGASVQTNEANGTTKKLDIASANAISNNNDSNTPKKLTLKERAAQLERDMRKAAEEANKQNINHNTEALLNSSTPLDNSSATVKDLKKEFGPVRTKSDIDDFNISNKSNPDALLSSPTTLDKGQDSKQDGALVQTNEANGIKKLDIVNDASANAVSNNNNPTADTPKKLTIKERAAQLERDMRKAYEEENKRVNAANNAQDPATTQGSITNNMQDAQNSTTNPQNTAVAEHDNVQQLPDTSGNNQATQNMPSNENKNDQTVKNQQNEINSEADGLTANTSSNSLQDTEASLEAIGQKVKNTEEEIQASKDTLGDLTDLLHGI